MFLRELREKVQFLKGIGPRLAVLFDKRGVVSIADLLFHVPRRYEDRRLRSTLREAWKKERANVVAVVVAFDYVGKSYKKTLKVYIQDGSGVAALLCFGRNFLERVLQIGKRFFFSGVFSYRFGEIQSSNFEYIELEEFDSSGHDILPLYPLTEGLRQKTVVRAVEQALERFADSIEDELPPSLIERYAFMPKKEALREIHFPTDADSLEQAQKTLKYEELFYLELIILRRALKRKINRLPRTKPELRLRSQLLERLPFTLTAGQTRAIEEIESDLFSDFPMTRLLQGDVGSGKTLVALASALSLIECGEQVVFMAPTELLARQHADTMARLTEPLGVRSALLSGNVEAKARRRLTASLARGDIDLVVGTHALFSQDVTWQRLGLVIIDEQHRFGVLQRQALIDKGQSPDLLLMTATPIPRSLALTAFGDLDVSLIRDKPPGRLPVITHLAREGNETKVYERVRTELRAGRQAYFIYPLIQESAKTDLKNAIGMYENLRSAVFPEFSVGLVHSKIPDEEKRATMERFLRGSIDILVATSVVEVGVDVPNATMMVIEHAERFGLSALHQLRGRVGRSAYQSFAFLVFSDNLTEDAITRLKIMKETADGFIIAGEDLKIRGPGALLGVEQAGYLRLHFADLVSDAGTLLQAREDAQAILREDPGLLAVENRVVREVLERIPPFNETLIDTG